jgi:hypothetical protein
MDAKYNYIIDSMNWRIVLKLAGFGLVAGNERGVAAVGLTERAQHCNDCGNGLCEAHAMKCGLCHQVFCSGCSFHEDSSHSKPSSGEKVKLDPVPQAHRAA